MFPNQSYQALHLPRHFKVRRFIPFIIAIPPLLSMRMTYGYSGIKQRNIKPKYFSSR